MPEPITVWRVRLQRGDVRDHEGTLSLDDDALVFEDRDSSSLTRLDFSAIRSAKRVRASPILLVTHDDEGMRVQTAFYFSQPPPLEAPPGGSADERSTGRPLGPLAAARGTSRKRQQRDNVRYLTAKSGGAKQTIEAWADAIRARTRR